ncbi:MAG: hypothetical protein [crAssphage sp. isolate ctcc615]|uniref:Uncharacterized protein n=1 Tax=crAssphage sp. isolate ctcc615 TaxID=2989853 RepID=A0A345BNY0_9CAUD|nr:MAG: hypothetical protein KNU00_gp56 [crAssphage sp. isolate ctcc615]AXF52151.1 MAG: hypothetical protein [crAssphage sp. isolate ctcc615]
MDGQEIDFEGSVVKGQDTTSGSKSEDTIKQEDVTNLGSNDVDDITKEEQPKDDKDNVNKDDNPSTGELVTGDQVEVDGITYTVSEKGDLIDEKGNVFKEAKDVAEWLKSVDVEDNNDSGAITVSSLQEALGVTITDDKGNPIEFTNDAAGAKSYVDSVIELRSKELQEAAINRLYSDNPLLKQFQDYVQLNGTPRGFGEIPDRSGIKLDKNNEHQLEAVIRMAAKEFGNKSLNDNYIKYLKDSGGLYDEAKLQLDALVEKDKNYRKDIETKAAQQRAEEAENIKNYWEGVNKLINGRIISGYKIPESFTKEVNGKKVVITPNDFFDYVSNAAVETESGRKITAYQRDLANLTDEEYLSREMLDAWLMFTGGTYKDLIDMAVKEDAVRKLVIKSKQSSSAKSVKVVKKQTGKTDINDILF